jgi:hypothetical protein
MNVLPQSRSRGMAMNRRCEGGIMFSGGDTGKGDRKLTLSWTADPEVTAVYTYVRLNHV